MSGETLSPNQRNYCVLRAQGVQVQTAAAQVGVTAETGSRWNSLPAVADEIDRLQEPIRRRVMQKFRAHVERAADRIVECMEPGYNLGNAAAVNLRAAEIVIKNAGMEPASKAEITGADGGPLVVERVEFGGQ